jgi:hypothetical protein
VLDKYRAIIAWCRHHRDDADRNWFLALPFARPWYIDPLSSPPLTGD